MKASVLLLIVYFFLPFNSEIFSQNSNSKNIDFKISQDGIVAEGSVKIATEFAFYGYPYLKVKYSDLEISTFNYKNRYFSNTSNRDILAFPFKPAKGGYYINAELAVTIAYEDISGALVANQNLIRQTFDENIKTFRIVDKIYTLTDTYSNEDIDTYFRQLSSENYSDADIWEKSALIGAKITGLSPNIIRQMTSVIDAKLREKNQDKSGKEDFDDFLSGNKNDGDDQKNSSGNNFDDFLSGKKVEENKSTSTQPKDNFDEFLSGKSTEHQVHEKRNNELSGTGNFKDPRDGKTYQTVNIGNQTWMAENLAYRDYSVNAWSPDVSKYGYLYDWNTALNACPDGWHLPSVAEWEELINYLGGRNVAGGKMKSTSEWNSPNTGASNSSGFSGIPGGYAGLERITELINEVHYYNIGKSVHWWSSTEVSNTLARYYFLNNADQIAWNHYNTKREGMYVRCLRN